jgi:hypothetical protein
MTPTTSTAYTLTATNAGGSTTSTVKVMVPTDNSTLLPVILDFSAQPPVINLNTNDTSTISWSVYKANTINISSASSDTGNTTTGENITCTAIGNQRVSPTDNQTYTLTATNWYGTTTATLDVTAWGSIFIPIKGRPIPIWVENTTADAVSLLPVVTWFSAEPATIIDGNTSVLNWRIVHATRILLNGLLVPAEGSKVISLSAGGADSMSTAYTLSAYNAYGSYSVSQTITVLACNPEWFTPVGSN